MGIEFKVTVHKAEGLLNAESGGLLKKKDRKSDPFAQIIFKEFKGKTKTIDNTLDPEWNEDFNIPMDKSLDSGSELTVEIYDYEKVGGSRPLGMAVIRLAPLLKKGSISQEWYRLQPKKSEAATGRVQLSMTYNDPDNPPEKEVATASDAAAAATELDGGGGGVEGDGEGGGAVAGTPRVRLANRKATKNSTPRTTKVVDWQVRIHVIEGRNLIGSTVDPVAKIVIGTQRKQSRVHKTNANPRFDEYFVFNFQESSQKLFDQVVELKVFNAKRIFKDALIGSFSIDIGTIYDEDNHQFPNTWIMLTDIDSGDSSVRGYLKVTMTVLGPGDEAVIPEDTEDDADFETKVLRPFGAELETIDICFKMYSAEDVPQKDVALQTGVKAIDKFTGQADKMYCDPYAKVIFAGKFNTTKVIDDTYFPEWNEEIHLMAQIPSMLNKIKLQLWDSDTPSALVGMKIEAFRSGDDIIATHHLVLNEISSIDADFGFLPTFGPVYVPLYGGPRKFQTVYDDHYKRIDEGVGEGMAYRGRVLCEVSAKPLGEDKLGENAALMPSDIDRAKAFLRRIEYHLKVVIGEVNFLDPDQFSKGDLTFEVSIGMVGNIDALPDDTPNPVNSLTFPAPGISDGAHYRTIAFDNKKPCIELRSEWEDVLFRIFALNQYRLISLNLKEGVDFAAALVVPTPSGEVDERKVDQAREHLREVINKLIADSERPLPELPESLCTPLDRRILEKRQREMATTAFECRELLENLMNRQISVQDCIGSLKATEKHMAADAFESQISIPDIIVWLFHKNERVAYHRFPVADFCFSKNGAQRGAKYGKPQTVFLKSVKPRPKKAVRDRIPGQIQLRIFFGSTDSLPDWPRLNGQGVILAESYENQRYFPIKGWGDMLLPTDPPKFSDKRGKEKKPKDTFKEPEGWTWNGDWYVDPDIPDVDIYGDQDLVVIEVFENERKQPIAGYCKTLLPTDPPTWSDRAGTEKRVKDEVELPKGWTWRTSWQIDMTRAVDKDGWEYGSSFKSDFHASAKRFDLVRRRRWYIERIKDPEYKGEDEGGLDHGDGWLYALDFGNRFRPTHSTLDAVRRRRWHRELISGKEYQKTLADLPTDFPAAGTFFAYKGKATYQFRGHMYQGRDLPAEDSNAFSDAFARVVFVGGSSRTIVVEKSLTPMWDQTVVFEVTLYGNSDDPKTLFDEISPRVVVELYDKDAIGDDDLLGRFTAYPVFRSATNPLPAVLAWYSSKRIDEECGEVLAAFEVIPVKDAPKFPLPKPVKIKEPITRTKMDVIRIPEDIRPELEPCEIEVLTWGLRNLKRVYLLTVNKPSVTVECGGIKRETDPIKSMKKFPNFETNVLSFQVDLPVKEIYAPPLNILVYDNRKFGAKPLVGSVSLKSVKNFRAKPGDIHGEIDLMRKDQRGASIIAASAEETVPVQDEEAALVPPDDARSSKRRFGMGMFTNTAKMLMNAVTSNNEPTLEPDDTIDWWNKFFASVGEEQTGAPYEGDLVEIYSQSLEQRFDLEQIIKTFTLLKGKSGDQEEKGQFKGNFRIFSLNQQPAPMNLSTALTKKDESGRVPHPWGHLPDKTPVEVFVRLYLVRGIELQPRDSNGKSDPFAIVTFGKNKPVNDKKNYIARNLNPIFGRVFEMPCVLPRDGELLVQIFDYDMIGSNDLIGETKIDLETRFLTRKRATAGLSKHYRTEGLSAWRDALKPSQILEKFCEDQLISQPVYSEYVEGQAVTCTVPEINGGALFAPTEPDLYETSELAKENAALMVLHFVGLVREHIETRTLYDPMQPDMDQGKIQMWVDIFPKADGPAPEPVNITPRKPKKYELRVVVYNTVEVDFADVSITGEEMSDIYIKSLIRGMEDKRQKTDVHYRSLNGEGNFNWRQVFPFEYIPAEERVHIEKRAHIFSSEFEVFKVPPTLSLQIWDADIFGPDEFIGSIDIDLNDMIMPARRAASAKVKKEGAPGSGISLFNKKRVQGWYACTNPINPERCSGKIEVEIELLTEVEALERPAGQARDEPNQNPHLEPPKRPATSFMWFASPWKTFRYIIWKHYKWYIIGFIVLVLLVAAIVIFVYTAPSSVMDSLVRALDPRS